MTDPQKIDLPDRPPLVLKFGEHSFKMTYGLEMDIRRLLPDPQSAMTLAMSDPFTQDYIVRRVLTPKNEVITNKDDLISSSDVDLDPDEVEKVVIWAVEHCLYFFMKRAASLGEIGARYQAVLPNPSTSGSEDSASKTASAGPSE